MRDVFREQRNAILSYLRTGEKSIILALKDDQESGAGRATWYFPSWDEFKLGVLSISERFVPVISGVWDWSIQRFAPRVGLDPDEWSVVNPHTLHAVGRQAFNFCQSTNESTTASLDVALNKLREELAVGIVEEGDTLREMTRRVNTIFNKAEKGKAREIAQAETSRAVHSAQEIAAKASGVVRGWRWLASADACDVCLAIASRSPTVKLGQPFAVIGKNPAYKDVYFPPAHPRCNCTVTEILVSDPEPTFHSTLIQPQAVTPEEVDQLGAEQRRQWEDVARTWDPVTGQYGPSSFGPPVKPPLQRVQKPRPVRKPPVLPRKPLKPRADRIIEPPVEVSPYVPSSGPGEVIQPKTPPFHEVVLAAVENVPEDRLVWGDRAWIHHIWEAYQAIPGAEQLSLEKFKERIVDDPAIRSRMTRADLVQALNFDDVQSAETDFVLGGRRIAQWHFIRRASAQN